MPRADVLLAVGSNPPSRTSGLRTLNRLQQARDCGLRRYMAGFCRSSVAASKHAGKRALRVRLTFRKPILRRDAALLCQGGRVRVVVLPSREVTGHASSGVVMDFLPRVTGADRAHVHIAHFSAGGTLGEHAAPMRQMFAILSGEGEVVSDGGEPRRVSAGQAVIWESGEVHQSWAVTEMVVVIVETTGSVDLDEHFAET